MNRNVLLIVWAVAMAVAMCSKSKADVRVSNCSFGVRAVVCQTYTLRPQPDAKIIQVPIQDQEPVELWAKRCDAILHIGKGIEPNRWEIRNPDCRPN